jgi:hypothetical protein
VLFERTKGLVRKKERKFMYKSYPPSSGSGCGLLSIPTLISFLCRLIFYECGNELVNKIKEAIQQKIDKRKSQYHESHNKVCNDNLQIEIDTLE